MIKQGLPWIIILEKNNISQVEYSIKRKNYIELDKEGQF